MNQLNRRYGMILLSGLAIPDWVFQHICQLCSFVLRLDLLDRRQNPDALPLQSRSMAVKTQGLVITISTDFDEGLCDGVKGVLFSVTTAKDGVVTQMTLAVSEAKEIAVASYDWPRIGSANDNDRLVH